MPATGDRITKRKEGLFMARYTVHTPDGPKRKTIYDRKYREVERKLAEAMGEAARGIVYDDENLTVSEYLDRWLSDSVRGTVRESTFSPDKYLVTNHINPSIPTRTCSPAWAPRPSTPWQTRSDSRLGNLRGVEVV